MSYIQRPCDKCGQSALEALVGPELEIDSIMTMVKELDDYYKSDEYRYQLKLWRFSVRDQLVQFNKRKDKH